MQKNVEAYARIFNEVLMESEGMIATVTPQSRVALATGKLKGLGTTVTTAIIEDREIVNVSVNFKDGHTGYETNIFTWAANEAFVRAHAQHAYERILTWNQWELNPAA